MTICPEHGQECTDFVNCESWRKQRHKDAEKLSALLESIHQKRACGDPLIQTINAISSVVPAIRDREEDPTLMIWAYALLVNRLIAKP